MTTAVASRLVESPSEAHFIPTFSEVHVVITST